MMECIERDLYNIEKGFEKLNIVNMSWEDLDVDSLENSIQEKNLYKRYVKLVTRVTNLEFIGDYRGIKSLRKKIRVLHNRLNRVIEKR